MKTFFANFINFGGVWKAERKATHLLCRDFFIKASQESITRPPFHMSQHHSSQSANILSQLICVDEYHSSIRDRSSSLDGGPASTGGRRTGSGRRVPAVIQYYSHPSSTGPLLLSNLSSAHHSSSLSTVSTGFFAPPSLLG